MLIPDHFVIEDSNIDENLKNDLMKLNFMLGMMEEYGNDLADNLLKHDNKGMNYAEGMVYDQFRKILRRVKDAQNMFTYLASNSNKTRIPRSPQQNIIGRGKVELDRGIEIKVTFIQKQVQVERIVDGVKKQLPTERTFTRCNNCSYYSHIEAHFKKTQVHKVKKRYSCISVLYKRVWQSL